jgi:hypothetical protein
MVGFGGQLGYLRSEQRARAGDRWQMRIKSLAMNSCEIGNGPFDFRHPCAATPAGGKVGVHSSGASGWEFAVRCQKQLLIRYVHVRQAAQHAFISPPHESTVPVIVSALPVRPPEAFRVRLLSPIAGSLGTQPEATLKKLYDLALDLRGLCRKRRVRDVWERQLVDAVGGSISRGSQNEYSVSPVSVQGFSKHFFLNSPAGDKK